MEESITRYVIIVHFYFYFIWGKSNGWRKIDQNIMIATHFIIFIHLTCNYAICIKQLWLEIQDASAATPQFRVWTQYKLYWMNFFFFFFLEKMYWMNLVVHVIDSLDFQSFGFFRDEIMINILEQTNFYSAGLKSNSSNSLDLFAYSSWALYGLASTCLRMLVHCLKWILGSFFSCSPFMGFCLEFMIVAPLLTFNWSFGPYLINRVRMF